MENKSNEKINKDFEAWLEENPDVVDDKKYTLVKNSEEIEGICDICAARPAKYRCIRCEKIICPSCFIVLYGVCRQCASPDTARKLKNGKQDYGVDIIK